MTVSTVAAAILLIGLVPLVCLSSFGICFAVLRSSVNVPPGIQFDVSKTMLKGLVASAFTLMILMLFALYRPIVLLIDWGSGW